jgi:hypothetical protein
MTVRDRLRELLLFTPWVSMPLALLGVYLVLVSPLVVLVPYGWLAVPIGVAGAVGLALLLRPRYRLAILDTSPLGVLMWFRRRR